MSIDLRKPKDMGSSSNLLDQKSVKFEAETTNPFRTNADMSKADNLASPEKDMIPERDPEFESDEFNKMYHEHLRRKEQIRTRIEQMTREKNFLEQLAPNDVAYMF